MKKYNTKSNVKAKNLSDILWYIVSKGKTSRREIEKDTGFSWGAVSESVSELISRGYVVEEEKESAGVGRTAFALKPNGEEIAAIGVDMNRTEIERMVVGFDGGVKISEKVPFKAKTAEEVLSLIDEACEWGINYCKDKYRVLCVGIAVQGLVDSATGDWKSFTGIKDWKEINIPDRISKNFGVSSYVEHDPKSMLASAAALKRRKNCLLVRADEGIGMAVMQDGKILDDSGRFELGHTVAVYRGRKCVCGRKGCLEAYSSVKAMSEIAETGEEELFSNPEKYSEVVNSSATLAGIAISNQITAFAPEKVIFTGKAFGIKGYTERISEVINEISDGQCEVGITVERDLSAAYGSALSAIGKVIKNNEI